MHFLRVTLALSQKPEQPKDDSGLLEGAHHLPRMRTVLVMAVLGTFLILRNMPGGRSVILSHMLQCEVESDGLCPCMDLSDKFLHPSAPAANEVVRHTGPGLSDTRSWTTWSLVFPWSQDR